jgi:ATP-dependent RNA helicase RhlE
LLFSATMPESIRALAGSLLHDPVEVAVTPVASTAETVEQAIYFVEKADKRTLLSWVLEREDIDRAIVFTRTKHGANRVAEYLEKRGVASAAIHGNKSQNARERALEGFKQGRIRALIATDIAARGIDIDELSFVINFDLPNVPEAYVHRIGRTGRAGASGRALSFCESEERPYLVDIERLIQKHVPVVVEHPYPSHLGVPRPTDLAPRHHQRGAAPRPSNQRPQGGQRPSAGGHERPAHHANRPGQGGPRPHVAPAAHRDARDPAPRRDAPAPSTRRDAGPARDAAPRADAPRRDTRDAAPRRDARDSAPRRDTHDSAARRDTAPRRDDGARRDVRDPAPRLDARDQAPRRDAPRRDDAAQKAVRSTFTGGSRRS